MSAYSQADAIRELAPILDKAPPGAKSGEWTATPMQAGHSSCGGSYVGADGKPVGPPTTKPLKIIGEVVEKLDAAKTEQFNKVVVRWTRAKIPFMRGQVTLETSFDETTVPRGPDHPVYEDAANARLAFWKRRGSVSPKFAAERGEPNAHNQTKWFGPHHRVIEVRISDKLQLATDGLSTPWAGIAEQENGVECEVFLEFRRGTLDDRQVADWANLLISIGDLVADGHRVARDVEKFGAILYCGLNDEFAPMSRIILSRDTHRIVGMPYGSVPLIRATPITEVELEGLDLSGKWSADAANAVLAKRGIGA